MVMIPYRGNIIFLVKLLPTSWTDKIGSILGLGNQMDDFKGRGAMTNRIPGLNEH